MGNISDYIYLHSPRFIKNFIVTIYNLKAYRVRRSGVYKKSFNEFKTYNQYPISKRNELSELRLIAFLKFVKENSSFYNKIITEEILINFNYEYFRKIPIMSKKKLVKYIDVIKTVNNGVSVKTGGTTGKSLEVFYCKKDISKRAAYVDSFRSEKGYSLFKKTVWFSGKNILNKKDLNANIFWRTDYYHKVKYFSTYHINDKTVKYYLNELNRYNPEYFVGFPSSMYDIAKYSKKLGLKYNGDMKAIFTNAETLNNDIINTLESFYSCKVFDQYGSAEGVPHIFKKKDGFYEFDPMIGFLEILDIDNNPSKEGRAIFTSFFTEGTPLIRYEIGDNFEMSHVDDKTGIIKIKKILGRTNDFVIGTEDQHINAGNISNCTKGVKGLLKFQILQHSKKEIILNVEVDNNFYTKERENIFLNNLKDRLGYNMNFKINYLDKIPREKSGKFRLIKNYIK